MSRCHYPNCKESTSLGSALNKDGDSFTHKLCGKHIQLWSHSSSPCCSVWLKVEFIRNSLNEAVVHSYIDGATAIGMEPLKYAAGCANSWYQECVALRKEIFKLQNKLEGADMASGSDETVIYQRQGQSVLDEYKMPQKPWFDKFWEDNQTKESLWTVSKLNHEPLLSQELVDRMTASAKGFFDPDMYRKYILGDFSYDANAKGEEG